MTAFQYKPVRLALNRVRQLTRRPFEAAHWRARLPGITLSPYLRFQPVFMAGSARLDSIEAPIGVFLKPEFLAEVARLSAEVQSCLAFITKACAVRRLSFNAPKALPLLCDIISKRLQTQPHWAPWLKWTRDENGFIEFSVHDYATLSGVGPAFTSVRLRISHEGRSGPGRSEQVIVPIEVIPSLVNVFDALCEHHNNGDIEADLSREPVQHVLRAIETVNGFVDRCEAPSIFQPRSTGEEALLAVTHMGHASLICDGGRHRILFDPWLFVHNASFEKQPLVSYSLGQVEAIFFTHHHADHMNPESLLTLPHDIPVFVPCGTGEPLTPRYVDFLRLLGFKDVRELNHGESVTIGDDLRVEAAPFFGEGRNRLGFGANCYLASRRGGNVLIHADASPDSDGQSIVSTGVLKELVNRCGPIQAVFGTWWQERSFVCNLSPLAIVSPRIRPNMWLDDTEMCDCPPEFLRDLVQIAGAKLLLLYAESGDGCFLPRNAMSAYVPSISHLWTGVDELREFIGSETSATVIEAQPYSTLVVTESGAPYVDRSEVARTRT